VEKGEGKPEAGTDQSQVRDYDKDWAEADHLFPLRASCR
jgi:hypothetical protein